jgi:hypothetical protein
MPKRAREEDGDEADDVGAGKRAQSEANKEYSGFRGLILAELQEFGPRGLSFKGRQAEVPFYFQSREHCLASLHLEDMKQICFLRFRFHVSHRRKLDYSFLRKQKQARNK